MSIVLPGVADAAEHLDGGVAHGGQSPGERLRPQRSKMPFIGAKFGGREGVCGPQRVDHTAAGQLDGLVHVDAQMLDRLERADDLTELLSDLCVFDGEVHDCPRGAERVGGSRDQHVIDHRRYVI